LLIVGAVLGKRKKAGDRGAVKKKETARGPKRKSPGEAKEQFEPPHESYRSKTQGGGGKPQAIVGKGKKGKRKRKTGTVLLLKKKWSKGA